MTIRALVVTMAVILSGCGDGSTPAGGGQSYCCNPDAWECSNTPDTTMHFVLSRRCECYTCDMLKVVLTAYLAPEQCTAYPCTMPMCGTEALKVGKATVYEVEHPPCQ